MSQDQMMMDGAEQQQEQQPVVQLTQAQDDNMEGNAGKTDYVDYFAPVFLILLEIPLLERYNIIHVTLYTQYCVT